jgi:hypothetical protein
MRIGELASYIVKHYFSPRRSERRYGILVLGAPGVGKSMSIEEAGREIASKLQRQFLKVVVRWSAAKRKFVINTEGEHEIEEVLTNADKFFTFTDFRLSTVEPSDLSGIPRSKEGITYYDPLLKRWVSSHRCRMGSASLNVSRHPFPRRNHVREYGFHVPREDSKGGCLGNNATARA